MRNIKYLFIAMFVAVFGCKKMDDFLDRPPLDDLTNDTFWTSEANVRTFAYGFYAGYFPGYASGFNLSWGGYFSGESLNDDFAPTTPTVLTRQVPQSGGGWSFTDIRKANIFIDRIKNVPMSAEAKKHWTGVGRFFRGLEYAGKVKAFGDYPFYNKELSNVDNDALYRPRDPRTMVMDSVLADFQYAVANVRVSDASTGPQKLIVNRDVVLAFMSRVFLYEGTWQKYQENNLSKANEYLQAAKFAASEVMSKGGYALAGDYRKLFNSLDLASNTEIIMYRKYQTGLLTHSLNSYVNKELQTGVSKNAVESYLGNDGLPISISPLYQGDKNISNVLMNRDPRLKATITNDIRLVGRNGNYSTSGYSTLKFLNEDIKDLTNGNGSLNDTQAPVIRLGEVLISYAEACAELGTLTQSDLDLSVNKLRRRTNINMPDLQVIGGLPAVNNTVYNDPKRDPAVAPLLWEIRRERRVELMMEGFRNSDLRRWKKYEYLDTKANPDINLGAWINKADFPGTTATIQNNAGQGYIIPAPRAETQRIFDNTRVYLSPLPLDQIKLYKDRGVELKQNPGW
ncbi:RagB/SusD family nutrient uptake outer membrane protein [Pedobacter psychrodurus]|uniref:RagB/SusD family nutrient uptake outer membrane protein n=1 Tax=Pedobacter psychrodurus TaxID=2530456 RepID=A0A4R0Q5Z7_9SPHI|nr:RagB/SusD family nutrient uptake outer membrane protein [Pedobacter psychrodurus]TCD28609.1 RagB/SusD family nutrient uptake outer membrane protein [Pedobacter psychrodurus]